jgi:hypothetical protein
MIGASKAITIITNKLFDEYPPIRKKSLLDTESFIFKASLSVAAIYEVINYLNIEIGVAIEAITL